MRARTSKPGSVAPIALVVALVVAVIAGLSFGSNHVDGPSPRAPDGGAAATQPSMAAAPGAHRFWSLVSDTRAEAGNDTARQSELLQDRLETMPGDRILEFARERRRLDERAYTWDIWGAAFVIEDGCSDDCFRDFRAYLISLGRGPYDAAMRDPDSIADVVQGPEQGDWENADDVAPEAYEDVTGEELPFDDSDLDGDPRGQPWDDDDQEALLERYPRLAARFR